MWRNVEVRKLSRNLKGTHRERVVSEEVRNWMEKVG